MKITFAFAAAVAALAVLVGAASGAPSKNGSPLFMSICEPDEADGSAVISQQGTVGLHQITVTNPCDSWLEFYFGVQDQLNPDEEFFVPPHTATVTVAHNELNKSKLAIKYTFWGAGILSNVSGPCPPVSPAQAGYLIEPDGTLQPFSCP